jgi:hypothetical protein
MPVDDYISSLLKQAAEKYPDCGFLIYVVDDESGGELTMLTNMAPEEVAEVHEAAADVSDFEPMERLH